MHLRAGFTLGIIIGLVSAAIGATWTDELVSAGGDGVSLAFDPCTGNAWAVGTGGVFERVDPNNWVRHPTPDDGNLNQSSIAFGGPNAPAVSYTNPQQGPLYYAELAGGWWPDEVDPSHPPGGDPLAYTSLAFKSNGNPAISYGTPLNYAEFNGSTWVNRHEGEGAGMTSLVLDDDDNPWIAYVGGVPWPSIKVAHYTGSAWDVATVRSNASNTNGESLALDPNGLPVVAWLEYIGGEYTGEGYLSRYNGAVWIPDLQPFATNAKDSAALAFDPLTKRPVVAYVGSADDGLWLARETQNGWVQEQVSVSGSVYTSIAFDNDGWIGIVRPGSFFYEVPVYYTLSLTIGNSMWGSVLVEPNLPQYRNGTTATLTAVPQPRKHLKCWRILDPNYPDDPNYVVKDTNNPIMIEMNANWQVKAVFKCGGGGIAPFLAIMLVMLGLYALARRNR